MSSELPLLELLLGLDSRQGHACDTCSPLRDAASRVACATEASAGPVWLRCTASLNTQSSPLGWAPPFYWYGTGPGRVGIYPWPHT
jgi:hypothetical protein